MGRDHGLVECSTFGAGDRRDAPLPISPKATPPSATASLPTFATRYSLTRHASSSAIATNLVARNGPRLDAALGLGGLGVLAFSLSLPATRAAVPVLGALTVGLGRQVIAGMLALGYLTATRAELPPRRDWSAIVVIALGVAIGFPVLSSLAMRSLPAAHGIVVSGLIPMVTACIAVWRTGEHPSTAFWITCACGAAAVLIFAATEGAGRPQPGDLLLLGAIVSVAIGYAEGGRLARAWGAGGGVRVISWAVVAAAPVALLILAFTLLHEPTRDYSSVDTRGWLGFAYLSVISGYLAYFPWYAGLARGGIARVAQVQLLQPVLGLGWAALLLGEPISRRTLLAALLVVASAAAALLLRRPASLAPLAPTAQR